MGYLKDKIRNYLTKSVICSVIPEDVFHVERGIPFLGNEQISIEELKALQEEVKFLEHTRLWNIVTSTLANDAQEKMIYRSLSYNDMISGKMLLYAVSIQKNILQKIKEFGVVKK